MGYPADCLFFVDWPRGMCAPPCPVTSEGPFYTYADAAAVARRRSKREPAKLAYVTFAKYVLADAERPAPTLASFGHVAFYDGRRQDAPSWGPHSVRERFDAQRLALFQERLASIARLAREGAAA